MVVMATVCLKMVAGGGWCWGVAVGGAGQFEQDDMGVVRCSVGIRRKGAEGAERVERAEEWRWLPIGCGPWG